MSILHIEIPALSGAASPAEKEGVALIDAATVLEGVDEYGPNILAELHSLAAEGDKT